MVYPRFMTDVAQKSNIIHIGRKKQNPYKIRTKKIMSTKTAEIIKKMLHDIVRYGTAKALLPLESEFGILIYGKTGTTNEFKDVWFIGCIEDDRNSYILGVFVGHQTPKSLGEHYSGARVALPIFANFIKAFYGKP
jgi:penicillin-binding protein 1A